MKKRCSLSFAIAGVLILVLAIAGPLGVQAQLDTSPTGIWTWHDLDAIREDLGGSYVLMNDLDLGSDGYAELAGPDANEGDGWEPIGAYGTPFAGMFDGQGYQIQNLYINRPDETYVGLFGKVAAEGVIANVGVVDAEVTGAFELGGLVGWNDGTVSNSYSTGRVAANGPWAVGGLVGRNDGIVSNSYSTASVTGQNDVGGLVGAIEGSINNCYASGSVTGNSRIGGLLGLNRGGTVINSYAGGDVTGVECVGGLVGCDEEGDVANSFWDVEISGTDQSAGGTGKTTPEMKDITTFTDTGTEGLDQPWDIVLIQDYFDETWYIDDGSDYPRLGWQLTTAPPGDGIEAILDFFDEAVAAKTLSGNGPGRSAEGRLDALRNMLLAAADLIEGGNIGDACQQLEDAYLRTDGHPRPPDFVTGPAAEGLAFMILDLMSDLGCQ